MALFSEEGEAFRNVLNNSGADGKMYLDRYYAMLTPKERKQVDSRMKTDNMKTTEMVNHMHEGQDQVMRRLGPALLAPFGVEGVMQGLSLGVLPGLSSLAGGYAGGRFGSKIGERAGFNYGDKVNNRTNKFGYTQVYQDPIASEYGVGSAIYDPERTRELYGGAGRGVGSIMGAATGGAAGSAVGAGVRSGLSALRSIGGRVTNTPMHIDYTNQNFLDTTTGSFAKDARMVHEGFKALNNNHLFKFGN